MGKRAIQVEMEAFITRKWLINQTGRWAVQVRAWPVVDPHDWRASLLPRAHALLILPITLAIPRQHHERIVLRCRAGGRLGMDVCLFCTGLELINIFHCLLR